MRRIYSSMLCVARAPIASLFAFSTTSRLHVEFDSSERDRERELRKQVLHKYNDLNIPEMTNFEYGHFYSSGTNLFAGQYAFRNADTSFNGNILPNSAWRGIRNLILFMTFIGFTVIFFVGKVVLQKTNDLNGLELPLWLASIERQSKYIIFEIQFDEQTKKNLKKEFESVHFLNPFVDFFVWVKAKQPEFELGIRYGPEVCINTLLNFLTNAESRMLRIFFRTIQMASIKKKGSPAQRLDKFIDQIRFSGVALNGSENMRVFGAENVGWPKATPSVLPDTQSINPNAISNMPQSALHGTNPFQSIYPDDQYKS